MRSSTRVPMDSRAVITGLGIVAPNGVGTATYWRQCLAGSDGIRPISRFDASGYPVRLAGEVHDVDAARVPSRLAVQTDRWTHLGLVATELALADAGVDPSGLPEYEMAVVTASSSGGTEFGQREIEKLWSSGPSWVGAYQSIAWFYAATTGQVSIRHGMRGPCGVLCAEQAGALDALAQARRLLRTGTRVVVSGGTDASLCPYGVIAQISTGRLSPAAETGLGYLPFDTRAAGYLPGEGGAMLIVERADSAAGRGARAYGEVAGHAATFDAPGCEPGLARAAALALGDAGVRPDEVDAVFADAAGWPAADQEEAAAIGTLFGPNRVPVTAPKTMTGRLYAGGAALDVATALLSMRDGVLPPTIHTRQMPPEYGLDLVLEPRTTRVHTVLVLARGYGGFNSAVVLRRTQ
jgi:minimal PKS chain-length factor (CLF/KS beta)